MTVVPTPHSRRERHEFLSICDLVHRYWFSQFIMDIYGYAIEVPCARSRITLGFTKSSWEDAGVDLSVQITPVGDTTAREISAASQEVRDALERIRGAARIEMTTLQELVGGAQRLGAARRHF